MTNENLFNLVKSLDAQEKRYLKMLMQSLSGPNQKKYSKHFDLIVSMKKYDDLIWKRKMGLKASTKQINERNHYLYDFILRGLVLYSSPNSQSINKVLVESQKLDILIQKGMFAVASKEVDKLIDLCMNQQYFDLALHLLNKKRSIHHGTGKLNDIDFNMSIYDEYDLTLEQCQNANNYLRLLLKTKQLVDKYSTVRNQEIEQHYIDFLSNPLLSSHEKATNLRSKNLYFIIKLVLHYLLFDEETALKTSNESLEFFGDENVEIYNELYYGFMMNKRLETTALFKNWVVFEESLQAFINKKLNLNSASTSMFWFVNEVRHTLTLLYAKADVNAIDEYISKIDFEYYHTCKKAYTDAYFNIQFQLAKCYHLIGNKSAAIDCINAVIENKKQVNNELIIATKLLLVIIYFELNESMYLPYAVQSLYRSLLKTEQILDAERALINFLKKAVNLGSKSEIIEESKKLHARWLELQKDKYQRDFFYFFPYIKWIQSIIEACPFELLLQEEYLKELSVRTKN